MRTEHDAPVVFDPQTQKRLLTVGRACAELFRFWGAALAGRRCADVLNGPCVRASVRFATHRLPFASAQTMAHSLRASQDERGAATVSNTDTRH